MGTCDQEHQTLSCQGQGQGQGQGHDYSLLGLLRMLYRVYDHLVILVRLRHLNGNLKLAGSGDGIDLWGCAMGVCDTGWIGATGLIYGDVSWGHATGSGRWNWYVGAHHGECNTRWIRAKGLIHGGAPWVQATGSGNGIDLWGCTMGVRDTGWIGAMEWQSTIWLLKLNDDTMCLHVWRWGKCAECVWLTGW